MKVLAGMCESIFAEFALMILSVFLYSKYLNMPIRILSEFIPSKTFARIYIY